MLPNIVDRILETRAAALRRGEPIPNTCRLPPLEAAQLCVWVAHIENDPWLGRTPIGSRVMGMVFLEDASVTEITVTHE